MNSIIKKELIFDNILPKRSLLNTGRHLVNKKQATDLFSF